MTDRNFSTVQSRETTFDAGLRAHMNRVYSRMTAGVLVTALVAFFVGSSPALLKFFLGGPQMWIVVLAPLAIVWFGFNPSRMTARQLATSFFAISVLYGISFSVLGLAFTGESIARAFFVAAGSFAGLSVYGYTTRRNLDAMASFMVMGLFGLIIASLLNIFFHSPVAQNAIAAAGIVVFAGLTAWNTQRTKEMYAAAHGEEMNSRMGWMAALSLYIDFIALFQYILHFMGNRR